MNLFTENKNCRKIFEFNSRYIDICYFVLCKKQENLQNIKESETENSVVTIHF